MSFANKLKHVRFGLLLTQEEVAYKCGLTGSAISHFETGQREPSLKSIVKICNGLKCQPNDLINSDN